MNKNANASVPFTYQDLCKQFVSKPRLSSLKVKALKTFASGLSLTLCLALLVQCLAFVQPVAAQNPQVNKVAQTKKKKARKNRKKKPATEAETAAALAAAEQKKAEELAQKEAEALAKKQADEIAKQEAAEKLAKKKAEEQEKKGAAKKAAEDKALSRPLIVMPQGVWAPPANASSPQTAIAQPTQTIRNIPSTQSQVRDLGIVSMKELSKQKGMIPSSAEPPEIKAIHPPQDRPTQGRDAVGKAAIVKESKKKKESINSPIASVPSPSTTRTFKSDNLTLGFIPPDTMGAVGPNHVVTTTNEKVIVHDRNGAFLSIVNLNAFWAVVPNGLPNPSTFDPKILYDRFNGRFIMVTQANSQSATSATLIATSQTSDPTGLWNRYAIDVDAAATSAGGDWADYPSIGHNRNWIVIQINRFGFGNKAGYQGPSIYVIDKAAAYAGALLVAATFQDTFNAGCLALPGAQQPQALGCGFTMVPAIVEDNTTNEEYLTEDWDSQFGQLRMSKITGPVAAPTLTVGYQFPQSRYAWRFNSSLISGSGGYVPQRQQNAFLPSGTRPTANDSRIQNAVLRNGTLWTVHHVMLARTQTPAGTAVGGTANPDIRTGIQWWQIDQNITNPSAGTAPLQRGVFYDPRADNCHNGNGGTRAAPCSTATQVGDFYTFPNIAVNANNDVLIGYSRFSPFTLPKAAYSFRAGGDPPNTMRDSVMFREGQGNYNIGAGSPFNARWGDYSSTMVDPVKDTHYRTIQEYALDQREIFGPGGFAGLWSTWWALIDPATTANYAINSGLIISEFRMSGPAGPRDEFVELVNNTNNAITVTTTDASDGWTLVYSSPAGVITPLAVIPNGTVIPAHGHFLITNEVRATGLNPYSLSNNPTGNPVRTADSDAMWTSDVADNGGFALFATNNQANFIQAARIDAVGFTSLPAGSIYREGNGLPTCSGAPAGGEQVSFVRKGSAGNPQDTNVNENDFIYTSSTGASAQNCQVPVNNGAQTPLNRDSPPSP